MIFLKYRFVSSSFNPTILFTRDLSSKNSSIVQLVEDMEFIYKDLKDQNLYGLPSCQFEAIIRCIISGSYVISPQLSFYISKELLPPFLYYYPDIAIATAPDSGLIYLTVPSAKEDIIVLMGLSLMLLRLAHPSFKPIGGAYRMENELSTYYCSLKQMGMAERLYRVNLSESIKILPISLVLDKVKPLVGDGTIVCKLIESFLSIQKGNNGIPPAGEITRVLLEIVLMDIFDSVFPKRFPGVAFCRYSYEVVIATKGNDEFDEKAGYALLKELGLTGNIISIGPGDFPINIHKSTIFLHNNGKVQVDDTHP